MVELQNEPYSVLSLIKNLEINLPDLPKFQYGLIEDSPALDVSSTSSVAEASEIASQLEGNIWSFPDVNEKEQIPAIRETWEAFYDVHFQEPRNPYISEAGPRAFDAALVAALKGVEADSPRTSGAVIQPAQLLKSLLQLSLGRESVLYRYSKDEQSFYPLIEDMRMSGCSLEAFASLSSSLVDAGNEFRNLQNFIEQMHSSTNSSPSLVALATMFSNILADLQSHLGNQSTPLCSLLELQSLLEHPKSILDCLSDIARKCKDERTEEGLLSKLFEIAYDVEYTGPWLRPLILRILASASKPWLDSVSGWLGLEANSTCKCQNQCRVPSFVRVEEMTRKISAAKEVRALEYEFEPLAMPTFMNEEDSEAMFETGRNLRLLEAHQPEHPLVRLPADAAQHIDFEWHFSWKDVKRIQAHAEEYELALKDAIKHFNSHGPEKDDLHKFGTSDRRCLDLEATASSEEMAKDYISASIDAFEKPLPHIDGLSGNLISDDQGDPCGYDGLDEELFAPPILLLPTLSFNPFITIQAHLTSQACLRLLFKEHGLILNLSLLYRYNLFGDGVFASALSHALFDPELRTTERRKGQSRAGTSGLKLGSRDTWPPATSELRLALMGILAESFHQNERSNGASSMFRSELPGGLSFSIREMSEDELERCMNPDSIEALDFLKLDYRPSSPLDAVITQSSLLKYDAIFKLLLRATRMLFVVNQLFRDTKSRSMDLKGQDLSIQSFRIESHHFVSATCNYFFDGVKANWSKLEAKLIDMEGRLNQDGSTESLSQLRNFHERTLDRMMLALILRQRQAQVMRLLEEIFSLVLQFAKQIRIRNHDFGIDRADGDTNLRLLYEKFRKKARVFVNVCRGLSERRGFSKDGNNPDDEENTISHLLLKLEFSGFYAID